MSASWRARALAAAVILVLGCFFGCGGGSGDVPASPGGGGGGDPGGGSPSAGPVGSSGDDAGTESGAADAAPTLPPLTLSVANDRGSNSPALARGSYDYAPSVMHDGVYKMWWCGGIAGDHVLYAEASSLDGPWHSHGSSAAGSYDDVFQPTGGATFDGAHTCDPSVVRMNGTYYLYYGGLALPNAPVLTTMIGVATSKDGMSWTRLNGGNPIIVPVRDYKSVKNDYGAGQPSAIALDGKIYLMFTDTTGLGGNQVNGAGQYVMRSADPTFQTGVEELGANGFHAYAAATHTAHSVIEAFSADWQYVDAIDSFLIASDNTPGETSLHLLDQSFKERAGSPQKITGVWAEGPGLASRPDKHAIPPSVTATSGSCGALPVDVMRAVVTVPNGDVNTWDLAHDGVDLVVNRTCDQIDLGRVYDGTKIIAPGLPLTAVIDGMRLQFAAAAPADRVARSSYDVTPAMFARVMAGASMHVADEVLGAPGRPAAFHLDDKRLWPVDCLEMITDNGSSITSTSVAAYDAIPKAPTLYCLR